MMPSYYRSRCSSIFFIAFLVISLYLLMNLMLAVVYEIFTRLEKDKFRYLKKIFFNTHLIHVSNMMLLKKINLNLIELFSFLKSEN